MRLNPAGKQPKAAVEVRSNAGSKSSRGGGGAGGGGSSSVQTLIVPPERVNETTFVMHVTNSPEESAEDDESSGVSRNPTPAPAPAPAGRTPLAAVNGACGGGGRGANGSATGGGTAAIRCASPGCPHRRSSSGRNGFQSQGSQTEKRKKPAAAGGDQVCLVGGMNTLWEITQPIYLRKATQPFSPRILIGMSFTEGKCVVRTIAIQTRPNIRSNRNHAMKIP